MSKKGIRFCIIAFVWTWVFWISAYLLSRQLGINLATDQTLFNMWKKSSGNALLSQVLFALAVFGPLAGFLVTSGFRNLKISTSNLHKWYNIILIPVFTALPTLLLSKLVIRDKPENLTLALSSMVILEYFLSNLLTSGTEEFGWRGVLYPEMKTQGKSFWEFSWKGGIIWAAWHYPLLFFMYLPYGLAVLVPSIVGFTASIVAVNYISNYLYETLQNIWALVVYHALNNTMSFIVNLFFPGTPFQIIINLMPWVIVWFLDKKNPIPPYSNLRV